MNPYTKWITVVIKPVILHVQINALTADQAADKYEFTKIAAHNAEGAAG